MNDRNGQLLEVGDFVIARGYGRCRVGRVVKFGRRYVHVRLTLPSGRAYELQYEGSEFVRVESEAHGEWIAGAVNRETIGRRGAMLKSWEEALDLASGRARQVPLPVGE